MQFKKGRIVNEDLSKWLVHVLFLFGNKLKLQSNVARLANVIPA